MHLSLFHDENACTLIISILQLVHKPFLINKPYLTINGRADCTLKPIF